MKKIYVISSMLAVFVMLSFTSVYAKGVSTNKLSLDILSPSGVKDYPGREETIKAQIKNNTDKPIKDILVYITMADVKKNMTVNLEDYSADKPVILNLLQPNETKIVELPIRFVYTSNYYLYTTAVSKEYSQIISSGSIPIEILGNTKVDKNMVLVVSYIEPVLLILGALFIMYRKKYEKIT